MAAAVISRLPVRYADMPTGWNMVDHTVSLPTTAIDDAGDDTLCFLFPGLSYLDGQSLHVYYTDMDSATSLVTDIGIGDVDGVIDTVLINDTTAGQAAGYDDADGVSSSGALIEKYIDVSGKYMIITVVTGAGTAVAGTVKFNFQWTHDAVVSATTA